MYTINLQMKDYLAEWCTTHFGNPITISRESEESRLLRRFLDKQPSVCSLEYAGDYNIQLVIPTYHEKPPRVYNYLGERGKKVIVESFARLFASCLWREVGSVINPPCSKAALLQAFMEKHGISDEHEDTLRKKLDRERRKYFILHNIST